MLHKVLFAGSTDRVSDLLVLNLDGTCFKKYSLNNHHLTAQKIKTSQLLFKPTKKIQFYKSLIFLTTKDCCCQLIFKSIFWIFSSSCQNFYVSVWCAVQQYLILKKKRGGGGVCNRVSQGECKNAFMN